MIRRLKAQNFKCFSEQNIPLVPFTILTGENASGKSSVLQILALIQQSWVEQSLDRGLLISGAELKLGTCEDILDKQAAEDMIAFELETDSINSRIEFSAKDKTSTLAPLYSAPTVKSKADGKEQKLLQPQSADDLKFNDLVVSKNPQLAELRSTIHGLQYITAARIGPREIHEINYSGMYNSVGLLGERAVWLLNKNRKSMVSTACCHKGQPPVLDKQVEAWMSEIFPGFQFAVTPIPGTNLATLGFANKGNSELIRPQNTGFGLSYTFPIFVACLAAKNGGLVLIENPEAHLHPAGQAKLIAFIAMVASTGVQIIIETHSDHIINGIRKAVKFGVVKRNDILIHYFRQIETDELPKVTSLEIDSKGNLSDWPKGFFDQIDDDYDFLTDWGE